MVKNFLALAILIISVSTSFSNCGKPSKFEVQAPNIRSLPQTEPELERIRFAVIGDYGQHGEKLKKISDMIKSWDVDFIITTGDNNYYWGQWETLEENIGNYFSDYIFPYRFTQKERRGQIDPNRGSPTRMNRFFPALGNHDWYVTTPAPEIPEPAPPGKPPILDWLDLPQGQGNERYYDFVRGPVHFFALDSDSDYEANLDGVTPESKQGQWLKDGLQNSKAPFKIVYFHHPPFSSGKNGNNPHMNWPFRAWGANLVLMGHDHIYEQYVYDGLNYIINGLGGHSITAIDPGRQVPELRDSVKYNKTFAALLVHASKDELVTQLFDENGLAVSKMAVRVSASGESLPLPPAPTLDIPAVTAVAGGIAYVTIKGAFWKGSDASEFDIVTSPTECRYNSKDRYFYNGPDGAAPNDPNRHQANLPIALPTKTVACRVEIVRRLDGLRVSRSFQLSP